MKNRGTIGRDARREVGVVGGGGFEEMMGRGGKAGKLWRTKWSK